MDNDHVVILIGKIIFISGILYLAVPTIKGFWGGAGPLISPEDALLKAFKFVGLSSNKKIYDLGAGTGKVMIVANSKFGANTCGFEISPVMFFIARLNLWLNGIKHYELHRESYYGYKFNNPDAIYCFSSQSDMDKLENKLTKELVSDVWIISYIFPFKNIKPVKIIKSGKSGDMYVYKI